MSINATPGTTIDGADFPQGCIARGLRTSYSTAASGAQGVLRVSGVSLLAGHLYAVHTSAMSMVSTVTSDRATAGITYTTDGTDAATGSSGLIRQNSAPIASTTDGVDIGPLWATYAPVSNLTLSVLLYHQRLSGTGNIQLIGQANPFAIELFVTDLGIDPGNTGVVI